MNTFFYWVGVVTCGLSGIVALTFAADRGIGYALKVTGVLGQFARFMYIRNQKADEKDPPHGR